MKHLIVLPGNSAKNKLWAESVLAHYTKHFESTYQQEYDHWQTGSLEFNFLVEEQKLGEHVKTLPKEAQVFIFAKSAGSILAFSAVQAGLVQPTYCAFFGIPFEWALTDVFRGSSAPLEAFSVPAIAFHNTQDPTAPYEFTKKVIDDRLARVSLISTAGTDHKYEDFALYDQYLETILNK